MSRIGDGYGSEFHLRRLLREAPDALGRAVLETAGAEGAGLEWLPFPSDPSTPTGDRELRGMEFVQDRPDVIEAWRSWWPQTGTAPSWDAVGRLGQGRESEWLLLEAKAHHVEFCSPPTGAGEASRLRIQAALSEVKSHLSVHRAFRWTDTYYQYANRLACLYFLHAKMRVPARLVFLYFCGDTFPDGRPCPENPEQWRALIRACHLTLGLPDEHPLRNRIHDVFFEV